MTDLSTETLKQLLDQSTPGPWEARANYKEGDPRPDTSCQLFSADEKYLGIVHSPHADLTALAPEIAQEAIRLREALHDLNEVWEAISIDPERTPVEQQLAAAVVDHINQILGDQDG